MKKGFKLNFPTSSIGDFKPTLLTFAVLLFAGIACQEYDPDEELSFLFNRKGDQDIVVNYHASFFGDKFVIVTHSTANLGYVKATMKNHMAYAKKQGYDYWHRRGLISLDYQDPKSSKLQYKWGLFWQKIHAVKEALDHAEHKYQFLKF